MNCTPTLPRRLAAALVLLACAAAARPVGAQILAAPGEEVDLESILRGQSVIESSGLPSGWFRAQYLMWWTNGTEIPALVTTSPNGTPRAQAGVLGTQDVQVLFGDQSINDELRHGLRGQLGLWRDDAQTIGLQADWFTVSEDDTSGNFQAASDGAPILARPFFNAVTGLEDAELVAFPNVVGGVVTVASDGDLHSGALLLRGALQQGPAGRLDVLGGYRYLRYREVLTIAENLVSTNPGGLVQQGTTFDIADRFSAKNDFHGAEIGIAGEAYLDFLSVDAAARLAIGNNHQNLNVGGGTVVTTPGDPPVFTPGGFLALPTNIGVFEQDDFTFIPQFDINLKCLVTDNINLMLGYSLVYMSEVLRAGEQLDRTVNPTQLTTPDQPGGPVVGDPRPRVLLSDGDFWAQGLSLGGEVMW